MRGRLDYPTETKAFKKIGALMSKKNFRVEEKLPSSYREAIDRFFKKQKNEDPEESEELNVQGKKKEDEKKTGVPSCLIMLSDTRIRSRPRLTR